ncbi:MAG: calcium-binding EGF-like domain-containing protein [Chitinophagales bacterium]|nr:calcium-binding EGF-like domain-containing protein [Chitinophagales bacterium]
MKKVSIFSASFLSAIAFATVMFFNACTSDPCKDIVCMNGGTCISGTCDCTTGYEGTDCSTESRTKFAGTWTAADACSSSGTSSYIVTMSNGATVVDVNITNFWDVFANSVKATVNGSTISIASQEPDNDGFKVSGQGSISGNNITWSYTIDGSSAGSGVDVCTSTWTK